jgi:hypothetical protein
MTMEKRGVVEGENEAPVVKKAELDEDGLLSSPARVSKLKPSCGDDPMSKMADAVKDKPKK